MRNELYAEVSAIKTPDCCDKIEIIFCSSTVPAVPNHRVTVNISSKHGCGPRNCTQVCLRISSTPTVAQFTSQRAICTVLQKAQFMSAFKTTRVVNGLSVYERRITSQLNNAHLFLTPTGGRASFRRTHFVPPANLISSQLWQSHTLSTKGKCKTGRAVNKSKSRLSQLEGARDN